MSVASVHGRNRERRAVAKADREFYALTPEQRAEREAQRRKALEPQDEAHAAERLETIRRLVDGSYRK